MARATVQRHKSLIACEPAKRGPKGFMSDDALLGEIRAVLGSSTFVGEGHRKVWVRLRHERGVRSSMRRVLRIMREHHILARERHTSIRGPATHDLTSATDKPGLMWAIECLREAIHLTKGRYDTNIAEGTALRHDHGSQFISHAFQDELKTLGIASSPSFVRQPEGNGCVERFIRTLTEQLLWLQRYRTVEELNQALRPFVHRFNNHWIIGRIGYRTPAAHRRFLLGEAA
jgi:hypothetical protein